MVNTLKAALAYFALVFGAGFLLGPLRILVLEPRFGLVAAAAIELPVLIGVMVLAARWALRHFAVPGRLAHWLGIGALAVGLQQIGDLGVALALRGMSVADHLAYFSTTPGRMLLASLVVFALMPAVVGRWLSRPGAPAR